MGERRRADQAEQAEPAAPAVETTEDVSALETACAVLDNEVERLTRIFQAQQEVRAVTDQVRSIVATAGPLMARQEQLTADIAKQEARLTELEQATGAAMEGLRTAQAELSTVEEQVRQAQRLRDELTALR
jgi:uncharacterized protein YoxC